jgi:hypothetical protein
VIQSFVACRSSVMIDDILRGALDLEVGRWGQQEQNRVARCLLSLDWNRKQIRTGDKRHWRYFKPVTEGGDDDDQADQTGNVTSFRVVTGKKR